MFQRMPRPMRARRERVVSLLLLPAFFLGTMPHTSCICADGHREEFCKATLCRAFNQGSKTTACCGCSCCKNSGDKQVRACCRAKACESTNSSSTPVNGVTARTGSCCHPFTEAPAPAVAAGKASLGSQLVLCTATVPVVTYLPAQEVQPTLDRSNFSTPPPLDAVIVFLHLTI